MRLLDPWPYGQKDAPAAAKGPMFTGEELAAPAMPESVDLPIEDAEDPEHELEEEALEEHPGDPPPES